MQMAKLIEASNLTEMNESKHFVSILNQNQHDSCLIMVFKIVSAHQKDLQLPKIAYWAYAKHVPVELLYYHLFGKITQSIQVASNRLNPGKKNLVKWNHYYQAEHIIRLEGKSTFNLSRGYIWCVYGKHTHTHAQDVLYQHRC